MTVKQWKNCDNLLCEALFDAESDEDMKDWKLFCAAKGEFVHVCRMRIREGKIESEVWIETLGSGEDECWISLNEYDENFNEPGHWMRPSETQSPILGE